MAGTSFVPWGGLRDFGLLAKRLSGQEEDLGSRKTTESALGAGRDVRRPPSPGKLP